MKTLLAIALCLTGAACTPQIDSSSGTGGDAASSTGGAGGSLPSSSNQSGSSGGASSSAATSVSASAGSGGAGGAPDGGVKFNCLTCGEALDFAAGDICDGGAHYAAVLEACVRGYCADLCGATDNPKSPNASADCSACLETSCASELADCAAH